jgi:hypothetical protein
MLAEIVLAVAVLAGPASPPDHVFPRGLPAAPSEDSCYAHRCVWDAKHMGNGHGQSMILTEWRGGFIAQPIRHRRAHRLLDAWCARPSVGCIGYED